MTVMPTLACPSCSAALKFAGNVNLAGKKVRCARCHDVFTAGGNKPTMKNPVKTAGTTKIPCPGCQSVLKLPANLPGGKRVKCPHCDLTFSLPEPSTQVSPSVPTPAPGLRKGKKLDLAAAAAPSPPTDIAAETMAAPAVHPPEPAPLPHKPAPKPADEEDEEKSQKPLFILIGLLLVIFVGGYYLYFSGGPTGPRIRPVYVTEGQVFYQGKPLAGARVVFYPEEEGAEHRPNANADDEGKFKLSTYTLDGDGAPVGRYKVGITSQSGAVQEAKGKVGMLGGPGPDGRKSNVPPQMKAWGGQDKLGGKYGDPKTSGLSAEVKNQSVNSIERFNLE
jgi:LSD1 subclass zinc finger protein